MLRLDHRHGQTGATALITDDDAAYIAAPWPRRPDEHTTNGEHHRRKVWTGRSGAGGPHREPGDH